jgi:hypothetical protein
MFMTVGKGFHELVFKPGDEGSTFIQNVGALP